MSCNSCAIYVLRTFLGCFDIVVPPTRITGFTPTLSLRILSRASCSPANRVLCHSIQRRTYQTESPIPHSPPVEERNRTQSHPYTKKPGHDNGGFSGIGLVGQQTKDLQEHVSSIAAISEEALSSAKGSQKKSVSTPARLARRERRMPSRRFKGDRTRPEKKEKITPKSAIKNMEKKPQAARLSTTLRKVKSPPPETRKEKTFGPETRERIPRMESGRVQKGVLHKNSQETRLATASKKEKSPPRKPGEEKGFVGEAEEGRPRIEPWGIQKKALEKKFGDQGWMPRKRLSPDALEGIRTLHAQYPDTYTTPVLAQHFKVSPENIRRILKSKWRPSEEEEEDRRRRWEKRGEGIWAEMAAKGVKPPKPWREKGIGKLSDLRGRSPSFAALEEQIGMECAKDVVTTRIVSEQGKDESLANVIL